MTPTTIRSLFQSQTVSGDYFKEYARYLFNLLANLDFEIIEHVTELILQKSYEGKTIYLIGNGGSATTAAHFATDLSHCGIIGHRPIIRAISLAENIALVTAIGNDRGYEEIFSRQLDALFQRGDILVAISASGNSPNLISAVTHAKTLGGTSVGMLGFDGGELAKICDYVIQVSTEKGEYGPVEDIHVFLDHMITSYLGMHLSRSRPSR